MGLVQNKTSVGRPSDTGVARKRQFSFPVSEDERNLVVDAVNASGKSLTAFLRDAVIAASRGGVHTATSMAVISHTASHTAQRGISHTENVETGDENPVEEQPVAQPLRTRAYAPPSAPISKNKKEIPEVESSSLRSSQALPPVSAAQDPEAEEPWSDPAPLKISFKLSSGETVTNTWLFANGSKIPAGDVTRLLNGASYKPLKKAMLQCFARSLRDTYRLKWCGAYNKRLNAWRDTPRSNSAFLKAAALLAEEYVKRGMTSSQFIDACDEMRPKAVRFIPVDMLATTIGPRVADWIPAEQRERAKPWSAHEDAEGTTWITPDGEGSPVLVIRSAADRERYLRQIKVK